MIIKQAAAAAGIAELTGNAPPAKQRGARYWRAFINALRPLLAELQKTQCQLYDDLAKARIENIELRQQLAEVRLSPFELLVCRARQGREQLEQIYRQLAIRLHPDQGGSCEKFRQLQADYEQVLWLIGAQDRAPESIDDIYA